LLLIIKQNICVITDKYQYHVPHNTNTSIFTINDLQGAILKNTENLECDHLAME